MPDRLPPVVRSEAGPGAEGVYDRFSDMVSKPTDRDARAGLDSAAIALHQRTRVVGYGS